MTNTNLDLSQLSASERADLPRATYFMLESYFDTGDHNLLASIEEAEREGSLAIHIGLPDRPARRYAFTFRDLESAMLALGTLKTVHPNAGMWLSCQELLTEIEGDDLWRGVVNARAEFDPTDPDDDWTRFAEHIDDCDVDDLPVPLLDDMDDVFEIIVKHLNVSTDLVGGA